VEDALGVSIGIHIGPEYLPSGLLPGALALRNIVRRDR